MKWSNFKEFIFSLFPSYYKEHDTYKDNEGRGILERFISVCSEYLDTDILPDIDNFHHLWDVDKTSPIYLNYLWEYFGFIPYAYGIITRGDPYTKENLEKWINEASLQYPLGDTRSLLKYAISLYKIRGTQDFYTILGRFYGINFIITDPSENDNPFEEQGGISSTTVWELTYDSVSSYDSKSITYDRNSGDCWECVELKARIQIPQATVEWLTNNGSIQEAKKAIIGILNKYLPIHAKEFTIDTVIFESTITSIRVDNIL